jgi:hypothetical protein
MSERGADETPVELVVGYTPLRCSMWGKPHDQVEAIFGGQHGFLICSVCVERCMKILSEQRQSGMTRQPGATE